MGFVYLAAITSSRLAPVNLTCWLFQLTLSLIFSLPKFGQSRCMSVQLKQPLTWNQYQKELHKDIGCLTWLLAWHLLWFTYVTGPEFPTESRNQYWIMQSYVTRSNVSVFITKHEISNLQHILINYKTSSFETLHLCDETKFTCKLKMSHCHRHIPPSSCLDDCTFVHLSIPRSPKTPPLLILLG